MTNSTTLTSFCGINPIPIILVILIILSLKMDLGIYACQEAFEKAKAQFEP